jgi:adenylate cyclase
MKFNLPFFGKLNNLKTDDLKVVDTRHWKISVIIGLASGLIGVLLWLSPVGVDLEKHVGLAWLFDQRGAIKAPDDVAVVAINSSASKDLGLPSLPRDWPRSIHGKVIDKLVALGASTIVFDVNFQRAKSPEDDAIFADSVSRSKRVMLVEMLNGKRQPLFDANGQTTGSIWTEQLVSPIPMLSEVATGLAPFPLPKVQVNVYQYWAFKPSVGDVATMPATALQMKALELYEPWLAVLQKAGIENIDNLPEQRAEINTALDLRKVMRTLRRSYQNDLTLADRIENILSTENTNQMSAEEIKVFRSLNIMYAGPDNRYLNFYGPPGTITTIPYNDIINGENSITGSALPNLSGKVVFIGFSDLYDPGQPDRFYTVFTRDDGVDLSGVEIAATAYGNLLSNQAITPTGASQSVLFIFIFGSFLGGLIFLKSAMISVPLSLLAAGFYAAGVQHMFVAENIWFPLATPIIVQLPFALLIGLLTQYLLERKMQQRFSKAVSYYLPENVAKELTEKEVDSESLNKVVYGVCFANDMSGFSTISQGKTPEQLAKFMNAYFDALAQELKRYDVDVTEFHADTIMCAWTGETAKDIDRGKPLLAALALLDTVKQFNITMGGINLNGRVGLEEGSFYLGHTGGGGRMGFSILGDCANTAARLESLNKHLGTHILSSETVAANSDNLLLRPLGKFVLKGQESPVPVVEVIGIKDSVDDAQVQLCANFDKALNIYHQQNWSTACEMFEAILDGTPEDGPTKFYLELSQLNLKSSAQYDDPTLVHMDEK